VRLRAAALVLLVILAGCGGSDAPKTDPDAVAQVLKDAANAFADGDGDKACGYLTGDAQRQAILMTGAGALGQVDCATAVKRVTFAMTPLDKQRIESLEPSNVQVNGTSASATLATAAGQPQGQQPLSVQLNLQKDGDDWKISGFGSVQGAPSAGG
jgi:hypothetical protein